MHPILLLKNGFIVGPILFLKNGFIIGHILCFKGMAFLSIRISQLSCWFCSALTLIIHLYEWM